MSANGLKQNLDFIKEEHLNVKMITIILLLEESIYNS